MITTVTLNTSIDKMYRIAAPITPGEAIRVSECRNSAGGKGLNVARVISLCGKQVLASGLAGGHNGRLLKDLLERDNIPFQFVEYQGETRSCINIITPDSKSTEFLEPGCEVAKETGEEFLKLFKKLIGKSEVITISGSLPKGLNPDIYKDMVELVKRDGKKVVLDTSGSGLLEGILGLPDMIKPNQQEMEALCSVKISDKNQMLDAAKMLHGRGISYVVVSLGKDGAVLVCRQGVYHGRPPKLKVVNTVGCGDSMVAALAIGLEQDMGPEELLKYAVAVSAANALSPETGNFKTKDLEEIYPRVIIEKVG